MLHFLKSPLGIGIDTWGLLLSVVGILLGLGIAIVQFRDARRKADEARADADRQAKRLQEISDNLSTRFLGEFPDYAVQLAPLIESAARSISILVVQVSTASLSNHMAWLRYKHALERKIAEGVRTSILTTSDDQASRALLLQYETPMKATDLWATFLREKASGFARILSSMGWSDDPSAMTPERAIAMFSAMRRKALDEWFGGAEIRVINEAISLNLWVVDERKAIFAISSGSDTYFRYGFETVDRGLVSAFVALMVSFRERYPVEARVTQ